MLALKLFAGACLQDGHRPLTGPPTQRRRLALLALLAASHPGGLTRDRVIAYLWPERDVERARNLLSQAIYVLRKTFGEAAIHAAGEEIRLNADVVACDVVLFQQALAAGDARRAVDLYSGPFLDGFFLSGAPEFEHWADGERERYRRAHAAALEGLARSAQASDVATAVEWWLRLAADDPGNSRVTLRLMEAMEAAGDRAGALRQARIHAALLEAEFDAEPDPDVVALADRLRTQPAAGASIPDDAGTEPQTDAADGRTSHPAAAPEPRDLVQGPPGFAARHRQGRRAGSPRTWRRYAVPGAALAVAAVVLSAAWLRPLTDPGVAVTDTAAATGTKAIAVLPFANLSRDPEEEYFSDGLTEELIGVLSRVRVLRVAARTSAFAFKGENRDIREIGRVLDVGAVLEGSVRKEGDRIRVIAQLVDVDDGFPLWSETYDREVTDIFAIWSDLAQRIAAELEAELTPRERERLARRATTSPEAHAFYLKGRHFWNQRTAAGYSRAIDYFERAIAADPQYAQAYAGLAITYQLQAVYGHVAPQPASERARAAFVRALELDDELAEAHAARGGNLLVYGWDAEAAERAHRRAIDLDPNYAFGRHLYAILLTSAGRFEEAIAQRRIALELDPLNPHLNVVLADALASAGRISEALPYLRSALELDSTYWQAHRGMGDVHTAAGRFDDAVHAHRRSVELAGASASASAELARALALAGNVEDARRILDALERAGARSGVYTPEVANALAALDEVDRAFAWLEHGFQQRHPGIQLFDGDARLAADPRYFDLLRRLGRRPAAAERPLARR